MKNLQKGFVAPLLIIIAIVVIGAGVYFYQNKKAANSVPVVDSSLVFVSPVAGEIWSRGDSSKFIQWQYPAEVRGHEVWMDVALLKPGESDSRNAIAEHTIRFTVPANSNTGTLNWDVFKSQAETSFGSFTGDAYIKMWMTSDSINKSFEAATGVFSVSSAPTVTSTVVPVKILSPGSNSTYKVGQNIKITWQGFTHDSDICQIFLVGPIDGNGQVIQSLGAIIPIQGLQCSIGSFSWNMHSSYIHAGYKYKIGISTSYNQSALNEPLISVSN